MVATITIYDKAHDGANRSKKVAMNDVEVLDYSATTEAIEIPMPDESSSFIMSLGGVLKKIDISWVKTATDISSVVTNIMGNVSNKDENGIISGSFDETWSVAIPDWGVDEDCIVREVRIRQKKAQPNVLECNAKLIVGTFYIISGE